MSDDSAYTSQEAIKRFVRGDEDDDPVRRYFLANDAVVDFPVTKIGVPHIEWMIASGYEECDADGKKLSGAQVLDEPPVGDEEQS